MTNIDMHILRLWRRAWCSPDILGNNGEAFYLDKGHHLFACIEMTHYTKQRVVMDGDQICTYCVLAISCPPPSKQKCCATWKIELVGLLFSGQTIVRQISRSMKEKLAAHCQQRTSAISFNERTIMSLVGHSMDLSMLNLYFSLHLCIYRADLACAVCGCEMVLMVGSIHHWSCTLACQR